MSSDGGQIRKGLLLFLSLVVLFSVPSCDRRKEPGQAKKNTPPVILSVSLLPEKAFCGSELSLVVQTKDPDGDPVSLKYQWIRNDQEIPDERGNSLKGDRFRKGDLIRVKVTPSDGKEEGAPFLSAPAMILNSPPVIQQAWIEPTTATVNDSLKAHVKGSDPDSDFVYHDFQWEKNGEKMAEEKGEVLEKGRFKKGDSIGFVVVPDDREVLGNSKKSATVVISNSPPLILSSPPTSIEERTYRYQVKAVDPDQDPITLSLKSGPPGMAFEKNTGLIRWEIKPEEKGTHSIEIEASDTEGARSIQRFTLLVEIK